MARSLVRATLGNVPFDLGSVKFSTILFLDDKETQGAPVLRIQELERSQISISSRREGGWDSHSTMELMPRTKSTSRLHAKAGV
jgi:hypothetical protein